MRLNFENRVLALVLLLGGFGRTANAMDAAAGMDFEALLARDLGASGLVPRAGTGTNLQVCYALLLVRSFPSSLCRKVSGD